MPAQTHYLADLLAPWAFVTVRRMFGGLGAWRDGVFFALIDDDVIYFKVDDSSRPDYERHESQPFSFRRRDKNGEDFIQIINSLWRVPDTILEDPDALQVWAHRAWEIARQASDRKPAKSGRKGKTGNNTGWHGLGPTSVSRLKAAGIPTWDDLARSGAIEAYRRVKMRFGAAVSLNLLWGLYAAINGIDIKAVNADIREHLKSLLEVAEG